MARVLDSIVRFDAIFEPNESESLAETDASLTCPSWIIKFHTLLRSHCRHLGRFEN